MTATAALSAHVFVLMTALTYALTLNVAYVQIHSANVKHVMSQATLF
jgi:hypothetical protein